MTTTPAPSINVITPSGSAVGPWTTGWTFAAPEDVWVYVETDGVAGPDLALGTDFTLNAPNPAADGGEITLAGDIVPVGGWDADRDRVVIRRWTPRRQATALPDTEGHKPRATERALDRAMRISEEQDDEIARLADMAGQVVDPALVEEKVTELLPGLVDDQLDEAVSDRALKTLGNLDAAEARAARMKLKTFIVTPEDFGAVGDGVADDTDALELAIAARKGTGWWLQFAQKVYRYTRPLKDFGENASWIGQNAVLLWDGGAPGAVTTVDCVEHGKPNEPMRNFFMTGIRFLTKRRHTAGFLLVQHNLVRSVCSDFVVWGIDGKYLYPTGRPFAGLRINGYSYTTWDHFDIDGGAQAQSCPGSTIVSANVNGVIQDVAANTRPAEEAIYADGPAVVITGSNTHGRAGAFFDGGFKIGGWRDGFVQAGNNGGVYMQNGDIIGNSDHNAIATSSGVLQGDETTPNPISVKYGIEPEYNRETIVDSTVSFDSGARFANFRIAQAIGNALFSFGDIVWLCSSQDTLASKGLKTFPTTGASLWIERCVNARIHGGVYIHNCGGHAVRVDEVQADVELVGEIMNNRGHALYRTVDCRANLAGVRFRENGRQAGDTTSPANTAPIGHIGGVGKTLDPLEYDDSRFTRLLLRDPSAPEAYRFRLEYGPGDNPNVILHDVGGGSNGLSGWAFDKTAKTIRGFGEGNETRYIGFPGGFFQRGQEMPRRSFGTAAGSQGGVTDGSGGISYTHGIASGKERILWAIASIDTAGGQVVQALLQWDGTNLGLPSSAYPNRPYTIAGEYAATAVR